MKIGVVSKYSHALLNSDGKSWKSSNSHINFMANIPKAAAAATDILKLNRERTIVIASDIDGTWKSPNKIEGLMSKQLDGAIQQIKEACDKVGMWVFHGHISARPEERILEAGLNAGEFTKSYNGANIRRGGASRLNPLSKEWQAIHDASGFDAKLILSIMKKLAKNEQYKGMKIEQIGQVVKNPAADACKYLSTICIPISSVKLNGELGETSAVFEKATYKTPQQVKNFMDDLEKIMQEKGINYKISPAYLFNGKPYIMFDTSAPHANKGDAVSFLTKNINPKNIIVAGDGGNDIAMMNNDGRNVIVVGNDKQLLENVKKLDKDNVVITDANKNCSVALLDGIIQVLKEKGKEFFQRGLIKAEPNLDNITLEPIANDSATAWKNYFYAQDSKEAFKNTVGVFE